MNRRARGSVAAFAVVLAIAVPALPRYVFGASGVAASGALGWISEAFLMALLGIGLIALASSVRRHGDRRG
jgi:hypothetical protein